MVGVVARQVRARDHRDDDSQDPLFGAGRGLSRSGSARGQANRGISSTSQPTSHRAAPSSWVSPRWVRTLASMASVSQTQGDPHSGWPSGSVDLDIGWTDRQRPALRYPFGSQRCSNDLECRPHLSGGLESLAAFVCTGTHQEVGQRFVEVLAESAGVSRIAVRHGPRLWIGMLPVAQ